MLSKKLFLLVAGATVFSFAWGQCVADVLEDLVVFSAVN